MTKKLNNLDKDHKHENLDNICENCNIENETVYQNLKSKLEQLYQRNYLQIQMISLL